MLQQDLKGTVERNSKQIVLEARNINSRPTPAFGISWKNSENLNNNTQDQKHFVLGTRMCKHCTYM